MAKRTFRTLRERTQLVQSKATTRAARPFVAKSGAGATKSGRRPSKARR